METEFRQGESLKGGMSYEKEQRKKAGTSEGGF